MQNLGGGLPDIRKELPNGNIELGEAFAMILNEMVNPNGVTNLKAESYDVVSPSWKKLANSEEKTPEDDKKLNDIMRDEISSLAESYLLFIARTVKNMTGKLTYTDYENYMLKYRFAKAVSSKEAMLEAKQKIKNAFDKISSHGAVDNQGKLIGDNIIDKQDMSVFLYALAVRMRVDEETQKIKDFYVDGTIVPREYALNEAFMFEDKPDNYFTLKLRIGYNFFYGVNKDK